MTIQDDCVVSIDYTLRDDEGTVIDTSDGSEPLLYLHGHGNIVPGLEEALTGKAEKDVVKVVVSPDKGYGDRDPQRVFEVERGDLPEDLEPEPGIMLEVETPDGAIPMVIAEVSEETVTLDGNHVLAGMTLHFEVTVRSIRPATAEERSHGHVHGEDGHHHH